MPLTILPRFSEVDVLGHVTNTALPVWFEEGRQEIFRHFSRDSSMRDLALILRRYEIDFLQQIQAGHEVRIETRIESIGRSSLSIVQQAFQFEALVASGRCVMVHFDYTTNASREIDAEQRRALSGLFTEEYAQSLRETSARAGAA
ncbi:acyl-CoA thioesterase [Stenotrophomonas maltophilia]|uniref:acyl-CoA thioesterase n=1 Tax=Stenotrophomonas maltophilia TaxID=40324 RepID=UPI0015DFB7AB|nr:thioesterase family protein [Stenotrophomonas maltophilia]MBA0281182.1 acyl-CoA thioesterase [Stenotrophomonas maltophilia]MBA0343511.1 acyl-CoA thioesterase [Stenotrophomonas maltophilia]MBA0359539.1 acyl-CoA thioesterase [Stenotrophomonas maltophilia]MBA0520461.1 acyl-CoA thioesterase [Stenotrophomonas maltophilia]